MGNVHVKGIGKFGETTTEIPSHSVFGSPVDVVGKMDVLRRTVNVVFSFLCVVMSMTLDER
jgi:hypothetical protein